MHLRPGRLAQMVKRCLKDQRVISCHDTLCGDQSICRGFWDAYGMELVVLRLAVAMGVVVFEPPPVDGVGECSP